MTGLKDGKHMLKLKNDTPLFSKRMVSYKMFVNMLVISLVAVVAVLLPGDAYASSQVKHPVSPLAREIGTFRIENVLFRYVRFSSESDHPCLRIETFEPIRLLPIGQKDVCKIEVGGLKLDLKNDVASSSFEKFRLDRNTFSFSVDMSVKRADSIYANCSVQISAKGALSEPVCVQGQPDPDSSGGK